MPFSSRESPYEPSMLKKFKDLTEREILALAISNEEEDGRIYAEFADALRDSYPVPPRFSKKCAWRKVAIAIASWLCFASVLAIIFRLFAARMFAASCSAARSG